MTRPEQTARWHDYLMAAQSLDAVRREAATQAAAATRTASAARAELAQVRAHLARQRTELTSRAGRSGRRLPLAASPSDHAAAAGTLAGSDPATVRAALARCRELLARVDHRLASRRSGLPRWWRAIAVGTLTLIALAALVAWWT